MKTILKKAFITILAVVILCCSALPCFAAAESGSIKVTLEDNNKNRINNVTVYLCKIAELNSSGYYPTTAFEGSGISIAGILNSSDDLAAKSVTDYIKANNIDVLSTKSENGNAQFSDLGMGIWVVFCEEDSKYTFNPYIVFLPYESEGKLYYEVSSAPKIEDSKPNEINIYVVKKWNDKNNAAKKRPNSVSVELMSGSKVISSAELSEANGWSYTFTDVPKDGQYSVREKAVADYKAKYSGDAANGFVVTNTYSGGKLPQTGQYWWPILLIAIAGVGLVALGIYEVGVKKNAKKK